MIPSPTLPHDLRILHGTNVRRLMARMSMTLQDVVEASKLDERTVRSILQGATQPHARTLHKLANGLGVATDELFHDPYQAGRAAFDKATNRVAAEVVEVHPELFDRWTQADFDELFSRMAIGGELTEAGTLAAAETMNARRELLYRVTVILESSKADLMKEFVNMLFSQVTVVE